MAHPSAVHLASVLPVCDDPEGPGSDLISLCDIVITGVETGWSHFLVEAYDYKADGITKPWAILHPEKGAEDPGKTIEPVALTADVVRKAVEAYIDTRLQAGMSPADAAQLVDGSWTDAPIADSILQFAIYGEEVFG